MKTLQTALVLLVTTLLFSCIQEPGPAGPPGPIGPQGEQGESGFVFEYTDVNFVSPDYEVFLPYPDDFDVLESDVVLVYLHWGYTSDNNGNQIDIWRQMPQTVVTEIGNIHYNFDFTTIDVRLFLVPEFDPANLQPIDTDDWLVRTVIVPGNFWGSRLDIDFSDYYAVEEALGLPEIEVNQSKKRRE